MRILLVTDQLAAEGGAEKIVRALVDGLDRRGHDVAIITRLDSSSIKPPRVPWYVIRWAAEGEAPDAAAARAALSVAENFRPDVVHVHNIFDALVFDALLARWPTVWQVHDHRAHCPNGDRVLRHSRRTCVRAIGAACAVNSVLEGCVRGPRVRTLREIGARARLFRTALRADIIAFSSDYVGSLLEKNGASKPRLRKVTLFTEFADLAQPPEPPHRPGILFVGRLLPQKGVEDVVKLGRIARQEKWSARIAVAGDGPGLAAISAAAETFGTIDVLGNLNAEALSSAYAAASQVVMPSRWAEPFGLVGIEAMAHARPVVAYDVGGVREWLQDGVNGIAVPPWKFGALTAALQRLSSSATLALDYGRAGWEIARARFRPEHGLVSIERAYAQALEHRGARLAIA